MEPALEIAALGLGDKYLSLCHFGFRSRTSALDSARKTHAKAMLTVSASHTHT